MASLTKNNNTMIGVIATLKIQEGKGADFEAEEGVVNYDLYKQHLVSLTYIAIGTKKSSSFFIGI